MYIFNVLIWAGALTVGAVMPSNEVSSASDHFSIGDWKQNLSDGPGPADSILLCSDKPDFYINLIKQFDRVYRKGTVDVRSGEEREIAGSFKHTLAFIGDPTNEQARHCLAHHTELEKKVLERVSKYEATNGFPDLPANYRARLPFQIGKVGCSMESEVEGDFEMYFLGLSYGNVDCSDDFVASLFSFTRSDR